MNLVTDPYSVRAVRHVLWFLAKREGMTEDDAKAVEVAVGEALANAHRHAYDSRPGPVEVVVEGDGRRLTVMIQNHGRPIIPDLSIPADLATREAGGRGLYIIGKLMDEVSIVRQPGRGVGLRLVKRYGDDLDSSIEHRPHSTMPRGH